MSLIHPLKFRTWETGHFKTPRLQTSHLQTGVFQMVVAVAFEHCQIGQFIPIVHGNEGRVKGESNKLANGITIK